MGKLNDDEEIELKCRTTLDQENNMNEDDLLNEDNLKLVVNNNLINSRLQKNDLNLETDDLNDKLKEEEINFETKNPQANDSGIDKVQSKFKEIDLNGNKNQEDYQTNSDQSLNQSNNNRSDEESDRLPNQSSSSSNILSAEKLDAFLNRNEVFTKSIKSFRKEFKRMGFDERYWRFTSFNKNFTLCSTYPPFFIIPTQFPDEDLIEVAKFRHINRIPSVVYRHKNGAVIARSSQPSVGLLFRRSIKDEKLLQLIYLNCIRDQEEVLQKSNNSFDVINSSSSTNCDCCRNSSFSNLSDSLNSSSSTSSQDQSTEKNCSCKCHQEVVNCEPAQQSSKFFGFPDKILENIMSYTSYNDTASNSTSNLQQNLNRKLLILDARSFTVACLNRAIGGGSECSEYYPDCEVDFLYLANIHAVRTAFFTLKSFITPDSNTNLLIPNNNYFTNWSKSTSNYWLYYVSNLIESALKVVHAIDHDARPVLIHCTDGWDRTSQIASLAELLLDPFYRTINGFKVIVQREWLDFGHKFADRCGLCPVSKNENSPIFVQWLDCVYQIVQQCPDYFEFNCTYLEELAIHTYSPLFGTFLCNSYFERFTKNIHGETTSVWSYLEKSRDKFINENYIETTKVLKPSYSVNEMVLWKDLYTKLLTDELEFGFDLKSIGQSNLNYFKNEQFCETDSLRKKKPLRTISLTNLNQKTKKSAKNAKLRRVNTDSDIFIPTKKAALIDRIKKLKSFNSSISSDDQKSPDSFEFRFNYSDVNFRSSYQRLDPQHNRLTNKLNSSNGSLNGTCKFESKTSRGFLNCDSDINQVIPLSVISKVAQMANSGNPDSSLMYSILTYVNTLHTFSVK